MNLISFPQAPVRAIKVRQSGAGGWFGSYPGDAWRGRMRTERGELWLVMDALRDAKVRQGLPIVVTRGAA